MKLKVLIAHVLPLSC